MLCLFKKAIGFHFEYDYHLSSLECRSALPFCVAVLCSVRQCSMCVLMRLQWVCLVGVGIGWFFRLASECRWRTAVDADWASCCCMSGAAAAGCRSRNDLEQTNAECQHTGWIDAKCVVLTSELLSLRIVYERRQRRMLIALIARSRVLAVVRLLMLRMHLMLRRVVRIAVVLLMLQLLVLIRIVAGVMLGGLRCRTGRGGSHQLLGDGRPQSRLLSIDLIAIAQHFVLHTVSVSRAYTLFEQITYNP